MSEDCDHRYVEPITDDATGDTVAWCSVCERVLNRAEPGRDLPDHWYEHAPAAAPIIRTAGDVLSGDLPRPGSEERLIHICGGCGHWMSAVHGGYFEPLDAPYDRGDKMRSFVGMLCESLCPECGAANFRDTSIVMRRGDAKQYRRKGYSPTRYIENRADIEYWHSVPDMDPAFVVQVPLTDVSERYAARCPCCGYAADYGGREFDFHHWDYEHDIGCRLCRDCHSHIHRGMRAREQAELSDGWRRDALRRLYRKSKDNGLEFKTAGGFINRFNIPAAGKISVENIKAVVEE